MVRETLDTHNNDNFDPWTSLGLATAMLLNRLHCQAQLNELLEQPNNEEKNSANDERSKDADPDEPARANLKIG